MQGTRLGPYEIQEQLGAGGMGEVWLARDTRLGRNVAIKVLPEEFASDPERLARFEQEARASAALNHPSIAVVHDVGRDADVHYMVQEYLQGRTLREVLGRGRMPLAEGLGLALEIAEALGAAHAAGIVHRDLKPENVFVTEDDHAKVLDFGLAKLTEVAPAAGGSASLSPTALGTVAGQIMGTVGYMAPEQIEGDTVDHRADLFAFGCLLYELAGGVRAFRGKNVIQTLDRIANGEPEDLGAVDDSLPQELARILGKALAKKPGHRYQSAGDLVVDLRALRSSVEKGTARSIAVTRAMHGPGRHSSLWVPALAAAAALVIGAAAATWWSGSETRSERVVRFSFTPAGEGVDVSGRGLRGVAISPDGRHVSISTAKSIQIRPLASAEPIEISGFDDIRTPVFSPDGRSVVFWDSGALHQVSVDGGTPTRITDFPFPAGIVWLPDRTFVASVRGETDLGQRIVRMAEAGGALELLVQLEYGEDAQSPVVLPGGEWLVFSQRSVDQSWDEAAIVAWSLVSDTRRELIARGSEPRYVPPGHLTFFRGGQLFAVAFDPRGAEVTGDPIALVEGVARVPLGGAEYDISAAGDLVFVTERNEARVGAIGWYDLDGAFEVLIREPDGLSRPALSPDETRIAAEVTIGSSSNIAVYDLERGTRQWLTNSAQGSYRTPVWSPDGESILFADNSRVYRALSNFGGSPQVVKDTLNLPFLGSLSGDGRRLGLIISQPREEAAVLDLDTGELELVTETPGSRENTVRVSPDGRLVAYAGWDDGFRVYVRDLETGALQVASSEMAAQPAWSRDGASLYFLSRASALNGEVRVVDVTREPTLRISRERRLFDLDLSRQLAPELSPSADGRRLLMVMDEAALNPAAAASQRPIHVIVNWAEELNERVPPR